MSENGKYKDPIKLKEGKVYVIGSIAFSPFKAFRIDNATCKEYVKIKKRWRKLKIIEKDCGDMNGIKQIELFVKYKIAGCDIKIVTDNE